MKIIKTVLFSFLVIGFGCKDKQEQVLENQNNREKL